MTYGLVKEQPNSQARRGLTLIAKTLQNLANGVNFGKKEPFMEIMNQFIQAYSSDCMKYFSNVSVKFFFFLLFFHFFFKIHLKKNLGYSLKK